jgi:hypothetical protein
MENQELCCSVCNKLSAEINIITEVQLEMFSLYRREDDKWEQMNGLWKKTREYFCEECFKEYAELLGNFYKSKKKV